LSIITLKNTSNTSLITRNYVDHPSFVFETEIGAGPSISAPLYKFKKDKSYITSINNNIAYQTKLGPLDTCFLI
jgi:hypothetical protein